MPELESTDGVPVWHPPIEVLELAELVTAGLMPPIHDPALPPELASATSVVLEDAEGTPVARYTPGEGFEKLRPFTHGPARSARRAPADLLAELEAMEQRPEDEGQPTVVAPVVTPWNDSQIAEVIGLGRPVVWLAVFGAGRERDGLPVAGLVRAVEALAEDTRAALVPAVSAAVAVPRIPEFDDNLLVELIAEKYARDVLMPRDLNGFPHPIFEAEFARAQQNQGVTVFFTGLSGSGKSTVAKALAERVEQHRTVSLLDGDEVRRLLSAGLTFSRADRDLNIRRIGFVATEVTRHGGLAICAPIAPFEQARDQVRASVEEAGDFVLVHVSTSLQECERRDRKGLYAKARQGLIPDFTGISSPYEAPTNADLTLDTEKMTVDEAVDEVWNLLVQRGHLGKALGKA